jgi:hypothetical protein
VKKKKKKFEIIEGGKHNNEEYEKESKSDKFIFYFGNKLSSKIDLCRIPKEKFWALIEKSKKENWDDETLDQEIKKFR